MLIQRATDRVFKLTSLGIVCSIGSERNVPGQGRSIVLASIKIRRVENGVLEVYVGSVGGRI